MCFNVGDACVQVEHFVTLTSDVSIPQGPCQAKMFGREERPESLGEEIS